MKPAANSTASTTDSIDSPQPPLEAGRSAEIDFVSEPDADDDETVPGKFNEDPAEPDDEDEDEDDFDDKDDENEDDE